MEYQITEKGLGFLKGYQAAIETIRKFKSMEELAAWLAEYDALTGK